MSFFINRKRSEFVRRYEGETLGRSKAFLDCFINIFIAGDTHVPWGPNECDRDVIVGEGSQEGMNACNEGEIGDQIGIQMYITV